MARATPLRHFTPSDIAMPPLYAITLIAAAIWLLFRCHYTLLLLMPLRYFRHYYWCHYADITTMLMLSCHIYWHYLLFSLMLSHYALCHISLITPFHYFSAFRCCWLRLADIIFAAIIYYFDIFHYYATFMPLFYFSPLCWHDAISIIDISLFFFFFRFRWHFYAITPLPFIFAAYFADMPLLHFSCYCHIIIIYYASYLLLYIMFITHNNTQ